MKRRSPTKILDPIRRWIMRFPQLAHWTKIFREGTRIVWEVLLARNRTGAVIRLFLLVTTLIAFWFLIVIAKDFPGEVPLDLQQEFGPIVFLLVNLVAPFIQPEILSILLPIIAAMFIGILIAALYITDLFELDSFWIALRYLFGSMLGLGYPNLRIDQGDVEALEAENANNPLIQIGGPGTIDVHLGFAAVFESESGVPNVHGSLPDASPASSGLLKHNPRFIEGFTRLRDVVDLRDRHSKLDEVLAVTREGIEVYARDVQMVFRVHSGNQERALENPYPYDERGIRRLVYGQAVSQKGLQQWEKMLPAIVVHELRDFVARRKVEDFLALQPHQMLEEQDQDSNLDKDPTDHKETLPPRREITESFHTEARRERLREQGLELTWVGVGAWELRDAQLQQTPREPGPGKTLLAAWRDLQLAQRYGRESYLTRKRYQAYQDYASRSIQDLIKAWKEHELRRSDRCYEFLIRYREKIAEMHLRSERKAERDAKLLAVMEHLERLLGPGVLGGSEG